MNGRERILAALRGESVDRVPVMLHNFLMAAREAGVSMAEFRRSGRAIARSFIQAVETYGYDGVLVDVDTVMLAGAVGVPVDFPVDMPARSHEPLLTRLADVPKLKPVRIEDYFEIRAAVEAVSLLKEFFKGDIAVRGNCDQCPFSLAGLIRGLAGWMTDLIEGPEELVHELLEYAMGVTKQFLGLMAEAGADILSSGVLALGTPALVEKKTRELLEVFAGTSRFILNAGCAIPAETPSENLRAMIRARG